MVKLDNTILCNIVDFEIKDTVAFRMQWPIKDLGTRMLLLAKDQWH